ncbi:AAA family ATPase, partial [Candidatus Marinimicrobia bacterium]|nr:AAA family ATPase [Candidatus Neomarinimicrobiota bacterium]
MKIKAISIENFRPFFGNHDAEFSFKNNKPVTLFIAPNNFGKTSLFEAIRWGLYGDWPKISYRGDSVNTDAIDNYEKNHKSFNVSVTIDLEHDAEIYRFKRWFAYSKQHGLKNKPDTEIYLSIISSGSQKKLTGVKDYQKFIDNILPKKVSRYFIVDGDDFRSFTDPTGDQTRDAIERLLNFTVYHNSINHLDSTLEGYQRDLARVSSQEDIKKLQIDKDREIKRKETLEGELKDSKKKKGYAYGNLKEYEEQLRKLTLSKKSRDEITFVKGEIDAIKALMHETQNALCDKSTNLYMFLLRKELISIHNEIKKLREDKFDIYPFNRQTLKDVIAACKEHGDVECLCGSKISKDDKKFKRILKALENPENLNNDSVAASLMEYLADTAKNLDKKDKKDFKDARLKTIKLSLQLEKKLTMLNNLEAPLRDVARAANDQNIAVLEDNHKKAELSHRKHEFECNIKKDEIERVVEEIDAIQKKINKVKKKDERNSKLINTIDLIEKTLSVLNDRYDVYKKTKRSQLEKKIQEILFKILTANQNFKKFTIDENFEYDVIKNDGRSWKHSLSNGQKKLLSVSFSLLWAVNETAD